MVNAEKLVKSKMGENTIDDGRLRVLDGWRGLSILCVLASHMLPLGPKGLMLNDSAGLLGMSLFFTLSGFLITKTLYLHRNILTFFIKRITRILPLAYLYLTLMFIISDRAARDYLLSLLFVQNYLHPIIISETGHFWSLCVEIHFYLSMALILLVTKFKGFKLLPIIFIVIVIFRIYHGARYSIITHLRVDEIIGGAIIAILLLDDAQEAVRNTILKVPLTIWLLLLLMSCNPYFGPLMYFRAVFASCLVGYTIFSTEKRGFRLLYIPLLRYLAEISYSLYVWHPISMYGWLGSGNTIQRYMKRPICFLLSFILAHLSTFYYEMPITRLGRHLSQNLNGMGGGIKAQTLSSE